MLRNMTKIFIFSILGAVLSFFVQVITAKNMSVHDYGILNSNLALCTMLIPIVGFGFEQYIYKFSSDYNQSLRSLIKPLSFYFLITGLVALFVFSIFNNYNVNIIFILVISQFFLNFALSIYQIKKQYNKYSLLSLLQGCSRIIIISTGIYVFGIRNANEVVFLYVLSSLIVFSVSFALIFILLKDFNNIYKITFKKLYSSCVPFGLSSFSYIIYSQSNIFILEKINTPSSAGLYSAAFLFLTVAYLIPTIIYQRFLIPKFHIWMKEGKNMDVIYRVGNLFLLMLGVFVSIFIIILSDFFIKNIFGSNYDEASNILKLLSITLIFKYFSSNSAAYLVTGDFIKIKNKMMLLTMIVNVLSSILFVHFYGLYGAVFSYFISELLIAILYVTYVKNKIFSHFNFLEMFLIKKNEFSNILESVK